MLREARELFETKQRELRYRLAELSQFENHMNGQETDGAHSHVTTAGLSSTGPEFKHEADIRPPFQYLPVKLPAATSVSPIQGFSRRPLSESELEFLSYENREVSGAEFRISSAISDSRYHNPFGTVEGIGCSVSEVIASLENNSNLAPRDASFDASTSPGKGPKSVRFSGEHADVSAPSTNVSSHTSAAYSYIESLASSVQTLDESLNDERKLLLISQHQYHSSVAKIAELERTVEYLKVQCQRSELVNQRIMERAQVLESALQAGSLQKMAQDSELHSTHQLVGHTAKIWFDRNIILDFRLLN